MNNRITYEDQIFVEKAFDSDWEHKYQLNADKIKKAVESGDEEFLDKCVRILFNSQTIIACCGIATASVNPILIPVTFIAASIGAVIGGLLGETIFDESDINKVEGYKNIIQTDIRSLEAQRKMLNPTKDKDKIANIDKVLKSLRGAEKMCDSKLNKIAKREVMSHPRTIESIFKETKLV